MSNLFKSDDDVRAFAAALGTQHIGKQLGYQLRVGSTNKLALEAGAMGTAHGTVFIAEEQSAGRGRRGRSWLAPGGLALLFSVLVRPAKLPGLREEDIGWIPLVAGLASVEAISHSCALDIALKWPNDIVVPSSQPPGWRKLGGILCESTLVATMITGSTGDDACAGSYVVIGIGLNVNQSREDLPPPPAVPTSVLVETGSVTDRRTLLSTVLGKLEQRLLELSDSRARHTLKSSIEARLRRWWTPQRSLRVRIPTEAGSETLSAQFLGLDDFGRLRLRLPDTQELALADAEVLAVE
ncbi:MAG TPA: biotin--[acetyl-CoA-carboxylase] ligase [Planctomycetota bacterium]